MKTVLGSVCFRAAKAPPLLTRSPRVVIADDHPTIHGPTKRPRREVVAFPRLARSKLEEVVIFARAGFKSAAGNARTLRFLAQGDRCLAQADRFLGQVERRLAPAERWLAAVERWLAPADRWLALVERPSRTRGERNPRVE